MQEKICLHVDLFGNPNVTITVTISDPVSILAGYISQGDISNYHILHDNSVLSPAFSFAFYGLTDGSKLRVIEAATVKDEARQKPMVLRRSCLPSLADFRRSTSEIYRLYGHKYDAEMVQQTAHAMADPGIAYELAKSRDLFFQRMETNASINRRIIQRFMKIEEPATQASPSQTRYQILRISSPSEEAFPLLWKQRGKSSKT